MGRYEEDMINYNSDKTCDCCGYEKVKTHLFKRVGAEGGYFCEICSSSYLSWFIQYPTLTKMDETRKLAQSLGWVANHLISMIRRGEVA